MKMGGNAIVWITLLLASGLSYASEDGLISVSDLPVEQSELLEETDRPSVSELAGALKVDSDADFKDDFTLEESELAGNGTVDENGGNSTDSAIANVTHRVNCTQQLFETPEVEVVDSTRLINLLLTNPNVTSRHTEAECVVLLFYATWCPFCSLAAPHFNALPRAFPTLKMAAVDAMKYPSFNTQYGVVGVPSVVLFHNGRIAAKYNLSEHTLGKFAQFIEENTGIAPAEKMYVTTADFAGPVSSTIVRETDYCLWLAWIFIAFSAVFLFTKSSWCRWIVEAVQNTWRESEAQHEHIN